MQICCISIFSANTLHDIALIQSEYPQLTNLFNCKTLQHAVIRENFSFSPVKRVSFIGSGLIEYVQIFNQFENLFYIQKIA